MNLSQIVLVALITAVGAGAADSPPAHSQGILNLTRSPHAKLHNVPVHAVTMGEGFWSERRKVNEERSIPTMYDLLESNGIVDNFRRLAGKNAVRKGPLYTDSDIYKWMEAAAFVLQDKPDTKLRERMEELTTIILAAQEPSGYLNTYFQDERKDLRWKQQDSGHELYCLGHLLQAAIAYYRATGERRLLDGAIRFVDYLVETSGPGKRALLTGHPELEMALVELYRTTGNRRHLELAGYLLHGDERLNLPARRYEYMFSGKPFPSRTHLEGHAVRAMYACSGATDYYMETGEPAYRQTLERLWDDVVTSKMYLTGGVGSRASGEAFGEPYELPNQLAYTESCAAIANMMWNWRMLAVTGDAKYTDVMERALYNGVNSGMSTDGTLYCYRNPLELVGNPDDKIRNPWYTTTCCPPNLERILASLPGYFYSTAKDGLYIHLYDNNRLNWHPEDGSAVRVIQVTRFPWEGKVKITVEPAESKTFTIYLRIPGWSHSTRVAVNGSSAPGEIRAGSYLPLQRQWKPGDTIDVTFDIRPQWIAANPRVRENAGRVAVQRGPLVYAMEGVDQQDVPALFDARLSLRGEFTEEYRPGLLGGVLVLKHAGMLGPPSASMPLYQPLPAVSKAAGRSVELTLIPYYGFANRGPTPMEVWIPYQP